ncbi:MAG: hypothetical protein LBL45_09140 [Treponema sp.]|jgi:hypothetical protein|nr:hypothetical protein [Treponema sp.]
MTGRRDQVWGTLVSLDSAALLRVVTDYHGARLLDDGFAEFLVEEGLMERTDGDEEEEEDEG